VRIRTLAAMILGAAAGAGSMYLLDPEHGDRRRRDAAARVLERGRQGMDDARRDLGGRAGRRARLYAERARAGFAETRDGPQARG
jgi:uncharacterized membrane protein YccC